MAQQLPPPQYSPEGYYTGYPPPMGGYYTPPQFYPPQPHPAYDHPPRYHQRYQPYPQTTYSGTAYSPNYERHVQTATLPEPGPQDLPVPRIPPYHNVLSTKCETNVSAESSMRASPISPETHLSSQHQELSEAERKKIEQNERRKRRNRDAQRKARLKQKETIEGLQVALNKEKEKNTILGSQLIELQRELEMLRAAQYQPHERHLDPQPNQYSL